MTSDNPQFGNFEQALGNHELSLALFRRALELDPESIPILAYLAHCSVDQGEIESGLELFE